MFVEWGLALGGVLVGAVIAFLIERRDKSRIQAESDARVTMADSNLAAAREELKLRDAELRESRQDLQSEQNARVAAETRLEETVKNAEAQRVALTEAENRLREAFAALAHEALKGNTELFARQAEERVKPLIEALRRYEQQITQMEQTRQKAYGGVTEQLQQIATTHQQLARQTHSLSSALRHPGVKGRWGELTLKRAVELAGLTQHVDFIEQATLEGDTRSRPDMVVRLPGERSIIVDAKAPTTAYLDALDATDDETRKRHFEQHARSMRQHMQALGEKKYWEKLPATPDFVVMFIPGESFFGAALEADATLIEDALRRHVILASPTTLIALLRGVAQSWQQRDMVENAQRISETAQKLFERVLKFAEHFGEVGEGLRRAIDSYNKSLGSWERRLAPMADEIRKLGVRSDSDRDATLPFVDETPRSLPESVIRPTPTSKVE